MSLYFTFTSSSNCQKLLLKVLKATAFLLQMGAGSYQRFDSTFRKKPGTRGVHKYGPCFSVKFFLLADLPGARAVKLGCEMTSMPEKHK